MGGEERERVVAARRKGSMAGDWIFIYSRGPDLVGWVGVGKQRQKGLEAGSWPHAVCVRFVYV